MVAWTSMDGEVTDRTILISLVIFIFIFDLQLIISG